MALLLGRRRGAGSIGRTIACRVWSPCQSCNRIGLRRYAAVTEEERQQKSMDTFYDELIKGDMKRAPSSGKSAAAPPKESLPKTEQEEKVAKAQIVFGSRLAGPAERRRELEKSSIRIAGILVPPRPEEPDNCCMSGCVNCVWDRYRDEIEDWAEKSSQARNILMAQRKQSNPDGPPADMPSHVASSMDDDGGGSEALWAGADSPGGPDLFKDIPVGIKEFMRTEKRLKEEKESRHQVYRY